ncbi:hypothetical protein V490_04766 [Pseudogymnoascus sp. VKM F-3557]|nr:hypothetical protein V490_04766 [Pseudogymnoascus sp. VKM F-3557]
MHHLPGGKQTRVAIQATQLSASTSAINPPAPRSSDTSLHALPPAHRGGLERARGPNAVAPPSWPGFQSHPLSLCNFSMRTNKSPPTSAYRAGHAKDASRPPAPDCQPSLSA